MEGRCVGRWARWLMAQPISREVSAARPSVFKNTETPNPRETTEKHWGRGCVRKTEEKFSLKCHQLLWGTTYRLITQRIHKNNIPQIPVNASCTACCWKVRCLTHHMEYSSHLFHVFIEEWPIRFFYCGTGQSAAVQGISAAIASSPSHSYNTHSFELVQLNFLKGRYNKIVAIIQLK